MPTEIISLATQLGPLVDKLGSFGVLIIFVVVLFYERRRLMVTGAKTFRERDKARLQRERYRATLVAARIDLPDTSDIEREFADVKD